MKKKKWKQIIALFLALFQVCALCGCASGGEVLSETNGDTSLCMEVSDYTGSLERIITIKNTQSGTFSVQLSPSAGNIEVSITDGNGETILSMNEQATLTANPAITKVKNGNGTYQITIQFKKYSGSFDVSWDVR